MVAEPVEGPPAFWRVLSLKMPKIAEKVGGCIRQAQQNCLLNFHQSPDTKQTKMSFLNKALCLVWCKIQST